ncbi:MAG: CCA tRNA nucleotidyltransferase, partial [Planctomycetota bacterium]
MHDAGHTALLAGGCVRDLLLGAQPQDFDVATDATPERVCELFRGTRRVGAQFGVVLVRQRRTWVEVATFREDFQYRDGRRPEAIRYSDARHDAQRRDFTINGMFLDPLAAELIDYVGGRFDLSARLVRAVGDPAQRFAEDHLRLLRAVRFAARLGFEIEPTTLDAIRAFGDRLPRVAAERRREELDKMFAHPQRARALS